MAEEKDRSQYGRGGAGTLRSMKETLLNLYNRNWSKTSSAKRKEALKASIDHPVLLSTSAPIGPSNREFSGDAHLREAGNASESTLVPPPDLNKALPLTPKEYAEVQYQRDLALRKLQGRSSPQGIQRLGNRTKDDVAKPNSDSSQNHLKSHFSAATTATSDRIVSSRLSQSSTIVAEQPSAPASSLRASQLRASFDLSTESLARKARKVQAKAITLPYKEGAAGLRESGGDRRRGTREPELLKPLTYHEEGPQPTSRASHRETITVYMDPAAGSRASLSQPTSPNGSKTERHYERNRNDREYIRD